MLINPLTQLLPATLGLGAATVYLAAALRLGASRRPWPRVRTASFLAASPPSRAASSWRGHPARRDTIHGCT